MSLLRGVSFDHLEKKPREVTLPGCFVRSKEEVILVVVHAGDDNPGWLNAYRKEDAASPLAGIEPRDYFMRLLPAFAEHVVVGWKHVINEDGKDEPVSVANIVELMTVYAAKAIDLATKSLFFCVNVNNFRDYKPPEIDADDLGKK